VRAEGRVLKLRHPADAIRAGLVLVPANRLVSLLPQRSVQENVALAAFGRLRSWGPIAMGEERRRVDMAVRKLQIDTRAAAEVRRLSGGNMQKVVIARWIAAGFRTLLCFDPTRGIDIGTKKQIYALMREIADQGLSVLLFTSELPEIRLACDRAIVLFGGQISGEMPAAEADEARPLAGGARLDPRRGRSGARMTDAKARNTSAPWRTLSRVLRFLGMPLLFVASLAATVAVHPDFGSFEIQSLALGALPLALAAAAQAIVVISGGIDLSIGSMIAVSNVLSARSHAPRRLSPVPGSLDRRPDRRRRRRIAERPRCRLLPHSRCCGHAPPPDSSGAAWRCSSSSAPAEARRRLISISALALISGPGCRTRS